MPCHGCALAITQTQPGAYLEKVAQSGRAGLQVPGKAMAELEGTGARHPEEGERVPVAMSLEGGPSVRSRESRVTLPGSTGQRGRVVTRGTFGSKQEKTPSLTRWPGYFRSKGTHITLGVREVQTGAPPTCAPGSKVLNSHLLQNGSGEVDRIDSLGTPYNTSKDKLEILQEERGSGSHVPVSASHTEAVMPARAATKSRAYQGSGH